MTIDEIKNGAVLDHIKAGNAMLLYNYLNLDKLDCSVAVIQNVKSKRLGKKDIIKISTELDLNLEVLGYIDPGITVNFVKNGKIIEKKKIDLPERVKNIIFCKNPRCITSIEQEIDHIFTLIDKQSKEYKCDYCENISER